MMSHLSREAAEEKLRKESLKTTWRLEIGVGGTGTTELTIGEKVECLEAVMP